jgi:4-alpha-glucanotransferase
MVKEAASGREIVGEDLGAVPPYVRPHLATLGIAGFKICHWEVERDRRGIEHPIPGRDYEECSFATYATHDHPPMAAMWEEFREGTRAEDAEERAGACWNLRVLSEFGGVPMPKNAREHPAYDGELKWSLMRALLATRSRYAAFMITDLFGMTARFNTPATVSRKNWSVRMPFTVQELSTREDLREEARKLKEAIVETGR